MFSETPTRAKVALLFGAEAPGLPQWRGRHSGRTYKGRTHEKGRTKFRGLKPQLGGGTLIHEDVQMSLDVSGELLSSAESRAERPE